MDFWIGLTGLGIIAFTLAGTALGSTYQEPKFGAWAGFVVAIRLAIAGWAIFVAVHFITKYW